LHFYSELKKRELAPEEKLYKPIYQAIKKIGMLIFNNNKNNSKKIVKFTAN